METTNNIYTSNIYDSLGVFSAYNFAKNTGNKYDLYATDKLNKLKNSINNISLSLDGLNINTLISIFSDVENLKPIFEVYKQNLAVNSNTSKQFKKMAFDFFNALEKFQNTIHAEIHKRPYNKTTEKAIKEGQNGKLKKYKNSKELFADLEI